ncbi:hypothetical protein KC19_3G074600 [Ceratodon purpureus]|uniref:Uncharacterized protein n=1 Tax=Ceratodon purpureus TaxID=3225 RepID=A0A8T0IJL1_CERPU|nr:hypothetical protein KC19_3G074600 [Ceratodon purpureus]
MIFGLPLSDYVTPPSFFLFHVTLRNSSKGIKRQFNSRDLSPKTLMHDGERLEKKLRLKRPGIPDELAVLNPQAHSSDHHNSALSPTLQIKFQCFNLLYAEIYRRRRLILHNSY